MNDTHVTEILGPDHKHISFTSNKNITEFTPQQIGSYSIKLADGDSKTITSTRIVHVFNPALVKIVEVSEAYSNRPATIALSTSDAGQGTLTALVRCGALEVPHSIRGTTKPDVFEIVYHPTRVATHKIVIMYNGLQISNKPIEINVQASGMGKEINVNGIGLYQARLGKTTSFAIDTVGRPAREFDVVVSGPNGEALPVRCYQTKGGQLQAEFTTHKVGHCSIGKKKKLIVIMI